MSVLPPRRGLVGDASDELDEREGYRFALAAAGSVIRPEPEPEPESEPEPEPAGEGPRRAASTDGETWWTRVKGALGPAPKYSRVRGDIEGLRAIAVMWVLLYHLGVPGFRGGFSGVDVFFVISGFLITSHLLEGIEQKRLNLLQFYASRVRRLIPAATLVLLFTVIAGRFVLPPSQWRELGIDVVASAAYVVNWVLAARAVDYLAEGGTSPVQHYWSLAVEEQFYLVWPVLIAFCGWLARRLRRKVLPVATAALVAVVAASMAWSLWLTATNPARAYFVSTTRVWELGFGALIVCFLPFVKRLRRQAPVVSAVGALMVISSAVAVTGHTPWPGWAALLPVMGTVLVLVGGIADGENRIATWLGAAPLRELGALSYAIYLWHWPLIVYARRLWTSPSQPDLPWEVSVGIAVASIVLAWSTGKLVETPIRFGDRPEWRGVRALRNALIAVLIPGLLGALIWSRSSEQPATPVVVPTLKTMKPSTPPPRRW